MFCPLEDAELETSTCPVRCIYRDSCGDCCYDALAGKEDLSIDDIASVLSVNVQSIQTKAYAAVRRIQTVLVLDAFLSAHNAAASYHPSPGEPWLVTVLRCDLGTLRDLMMEKKYPAWAQRRDVDIPEEKILEFINAGLSVNGITL
jgi:hypothetical protein